MARAWENQAIAHMTVSDYEKVHIEAKRIQREGVARLK
jgi:hypothetical protein